MEALPESAMTKVIGKILCCECGTPIDPNPANLCVACLRTQVDITEGIPKSVVIHWCKFCERYLNPPNQWVAAALETKELMALCLKKLKNLAKVKLIDANFLWTEPHSKRIKLKLSIQAEVVGGAILQQTFVIEYVVSYHMCPDCHRVEAKDHWNAVVQVRQKTNQRKTLFYVEQLLIKYGATKDCVGIKPNHEGLDFFFATESNARTLVNFFQSMIPTRYQHSKKLISHDVHSNTYNYKYSFSVDVVPVCKDNVVCLPKKLAMSLGGIGQICVANKVSQNVHLIDPETCQFAEINSTLYFKIPFTSLCRARDLVEYTVMNIEPIPQKDRSNFSGQSKASHKHILSDCWVVKTSQLGLEENTIHCRTYLGRVLNIGDSVLGLDLKNCAVNNGELDLMSTDKIPDVVLVKKHYADKAHRNRRRRWKLKHMAGFPHMDTESCNEEFNDFAADLEEDAGMRQNVNIYKDSSKIPIDEEDDDPECPQITLAEMMDDMDLDAGDEVTGEGDGEGGEMDE